MVYFFGDNMIRSKDTESYKTDVTFLYEYIRIVKSSNNYSSITGIVNNFP